MNVVKKAIASTVLTAAAAFGGAVVAQAAPAPSSQSCIQLGNQNGVIPYPASRKAVQQQGNLACIFGEGANGKHFVLKTFNLRDQNQARNYHRELEQLNRAEDQAIRHSQNQNRQRERDAQRNNPINQLRDAANQAQDAINAINRFKYMGRSLGF